MSSAQAYAAKQRAKEEEREAQEAAQRAEVERAEAERRAAEDAEAEKWMGMISTEGEGTEEAALQEESQVRPRFVARDTHTKQAAQASHGVLRGDGLTGSPGSPPHVVVRIRCPDDGRCPCISLPPAAPASNDTASFGLVDLRPLHLTHVAAACAGAVGAVRGLHKGPQDGDAGRGGGGVRAAHAGRHQPHPEPGEHRAPDRRHG